MKYAVGCKELRIGDIGELGTMGELDSDDAVIVYKETIQFNEDDPVVSRHFRENSRYPDAVVTENGALPFQFETHEVGKASLAAFLGGTPDGALEKWEAQATHFSAERSMEIDDILGYTWQFPRALITGAIKWNPNRKEIMRIAVKGRVMNPEDTDTPPISKFETPVPVEE